MKVFTYALGQLQANCYLLLQDTACILIDPGEGIDAVLEEIQRRGYSLEGVIGTHGHFDHILGVGELQLSYPQLPLYLHPEDEFLVKRVNETAEHFLGYNPGAVPPQRIAALQIGIQNIGSFRFTVFSTPGHTPGSLCLYFPEEGCVFTGDTLFKEGIGRYDFLYSSKTQLYASLNTLFELPEETLVYPGHGSTTIIGEEKGKIG